MRMSIVKYGLAVLSVCATLALGWSAAGAAEGPTNSATTQSVKTEFPGDPYMLATDPIGDKLPEKPILYQYEGRELRFADQKNLDAFNAAPAKYLAIIDQQMIQQQMPFYPLDNCMVTGDKLGGDMGKAVDLIYKNRLVRFCCNDCVKDFQKDPAKYIAKLDAAVIAKQGPHYPLTTCMVTGDKLGGEMGKPVDLVVGNQLVRFCCADCPKDFSKNPTKYLKMIDDATPKAATSKPAASSDMGMSPDHSLHQH